MVPEEIVTPIHLSTICSQNVPGEVKGFEYGRFENPTRTVAEKEVADLEKGKHAILFSSGMAAITAILLSLKSGDHIICSRNLYEGTVRVIDKIFVKFGINTSFIDDESEIKKELRTSTKMVFFESVSNPLLRVADIAKIKISIKDTDCKIVIDNTLASPFCIKPLELGADIIIDSTTKSLAGHHDTIGGAVITNDDKIAGQIRFIQQSTGTMLSPFDCFLLSRGLKTFNVRLKQQCENAAKLADWLNKHPKIEKVIFPGLQQHKDNDIAKKQMSSFGLMVSAVIRGNNIGNFFKNLKLVKISQSFGGFGTIIQVPRKMINFSFSGKELDRLGITPNLIRISVGLEDVNDIIEDLNQALNKI